MGGFVSFTCLSCGYTEERIGFGRGKQPEPWLQLYRCDRCKTIGSTWVGGGRKARCVSCYDEDVTLLQPKDAAIACPKCEVHAVFRVLGDHWE